MEDLVADTEGIGEQEMEAAVNHLGRDRTFTLEEAKAVFSGLPRENKENLSRVDLRRRLVEHLVSRRLVMQDPARDELMATLAGQTEGFVGSDLEALCREAGMFALREGATVLAPHHFTAAAAKVHATMNQRVRDYYQKIQQFFKGGLPQEVQPPEYQ